MGKDDRDSQNRLGELLVKERLISPLQLRTAIEMQRSTGGRLGHHLTKLGYIKEDHLTAFLSKQYGVPSINLSAFEIDPEVLKILPKEIVSRHHVIPVNRAGNTLIIAMSDPSNIYAIDDVRFITNFNVEVVVASDTAIAEAISRYYTVSDFDEALDDRAEVLGFLLRFQQWAAWFGYPQIAQLVEIQAALDGGRGKQAAKMLQAMMFERLFLDGLSLSEGIAREPDSGVGRADFVFWFHGRPIVTEVKIFPDWGGVAGLAAGVNELVTSMDQHQSHTGYLIVFNRDPRGLRCAWTANHGRVPFLRIAHKTVYVMVVAATADERPASARGKGHPVMIAPEQLHPTADTPPTP